MKHIFFKHRSNNIIIFVLISISYLHKREHVNALVIYVTVFDNRRVFFYVNATHAYDVIKLSSIATYLLQL